jgi:hypothetical protein
MSSPIDVPNPDEGLRAFHRLRTGDKTASAELAAMFLPYLVYWLTQVNPQIHPDDCAEAADEAILNLILKPATFDPDKCALLAYLQMSGQGDLRNLLAKERRHSRDRHDLQDVALGQNAGKYLGRDDDPSFGLSLVETEAELTSQGVMGQLTDTERSVAALIQAKERRTARFAEVMGITHLPSTEQRREVKKIKDRLTKRIKRAAQGDTHESP